MIYQLKIYNKNYRKWFDLDLGPDTKIAIDYEAADIGDIASRMSDMSKTIKIPKTPHNCKAFDFIDNTASGSVMPYRRIPAKLIIEGITVFPCNKSINDKGNEVFNGSFMTVYRFGDTYFEATIFGGNYDLISFLKEKEIKDLDFGEDNNTISWSKQNMFVGSNDNIIFPIVDYAVADNGEGCILQQATEDEPMKINARTIYPAVRLPYLMETICKNAGYAFVTDVWDSDKFKNSAVLCVSQKSPELDPKEWAASYVQISEAVVLDKNFRFPKNGIFSQDKNYMVENIIDGNGSKIHSCLEYTCPYTGIYSVNFEGFFNYLVWDYKLRVCLFKMSGGIRTNIWDKTFKKGELKIDITDFPTINAEKDDKICVELGHRESPSHMMRNFKFGIYAISEPKIEYGQMYNIPLNLPEMKLVDFFKAIFQLFGLVISLDVRKKIAYAYTFNKINENKAIAKDWTDKLDVRGRVGSFIYGDYAQNNIMKFRETEITNDYGRQITIKNEGSFTIDNETLEHSKDIFELPFAAVEEVAHGVVMAKIRYRERKGGAPTAESIPDTLLYINEYSEDVVLVDGDPDSPVRVYLGAFNQLQTQNFIEEYYPILVNKILRKCRIYEVSLKLEPKDVQSFNHAIPVKIHAGDLNGYFYVNKIRNHQYGKLTKVELVRIK